MLRRIDDVIWQKPYSEKARRLEYSDQRLLRDVRSAASRKKKSLADAIVSATERRGVLTLRVKSRAAMSELFPLREALLTSIQRPRLRVIRLMR